jgi:hypothetical protein
MLLQWSAFKLDSPALPHLIGRIIGNMSAEQQVVTETKPRIEATTHNEDILKNDDAAAVAVAEEHSMSIQDALRNNKRIVWWCFFFSMSAIGWYVTQDAWIILTQSV